MEEAARASVPRWVKERAEIGDLILIGSRDPVSRVIQTASKSRFSHAAVVTDHGEVTEAYDYSLTLNEQDEGIYQTSFEEFLSRAPKLHTVLILRPKGLDVQQLQKAARDLHRAAPPYPTFGATLLGFIRLFSESIPLLQDGLFKQHRIGKRLHKKLDAFANVQVRFVGDGVRKLHCAESAVHIYEAAGLSVDMPFPFFRRSVYRAGQIGDASIGPGAQKPQPSARRNRETRTSKQILMRVLLRPHRVAETLVKVCRARVANMDVATPGDYIFPADLEHATTFERICETSVARSARSRILNRRQGDV